MKKRDVILNTEAHRSAEVWKPITGFELSYEVSNLGRIRSIDRVVMRSNGRIFTLRGRIRQTPLVSGYPTVSLSIAGLMQTFYVHHLVAEAFIGPRPIGKDVAHGDGDKKNPALSNLRYATRSENEADKIAHGTQASGSKSPLARLDENQVREIRRRSSESHDNLAREFGCSTFNIRDIVNRRSWRHI